MTNPYTPQNHQSGASLIIALVLISISTLVGMSVLKNSNLGTILVNNDKFMAVTFRAAESSIKPLATEENIALLTADNSGNCITSTQSVDDDVAVTAELCPFGIGVAEGFRLGEGISSFQMSHFSVSTESTLNGVNTTTSMFQGAQHLSLKQ